MKIRLKNLGTITTTLLFWCSIVSFAHAAPNITEIKVTIGEESVLLNAKLDGKVMENLKEAIQSGVPMTFNYLIELRKSKSLWTDPLIQEIKVTNTVQYDSLQKVYKFVSEGKNVQQKTVTKNAGRYQELMLAIKDIPILPSYKLDPKAKYYVRVKAELNEDDAWFSSKKLMLFSPISGFETAWADSSPLKAGADLDVPDQATTQSGSADSKLKVLDNGVRSFNQ